MYLHLPISAVVIVISDVSDTSSVAGECLKITFVLLNGLRMMSLGMTSKFVVFEDLAFALTSNSLGFSKTI